VGSAPPASTHSDEYCPHHVVRAPRFTRHCMIPPQSSRPIPESSASDLRLRRGDLKDVGSNRDLILLINGHNWRV